jgi:hypothetical protein
MAEKIGKLIICDKCGDTAFLKCIGEGETDGGYTRWNKFETPPEGWGYAHDCEKTKKLCPKCYKTYCDIIRGFENG